MNHRFLLKLALRGDAPGVRARLDERPPSPTRRAACLRALVGAVPMGMPQ